jgi:hypothetical protein
MQAEMIKGGWPGQYHRLRAWHLCSFYDKFVPFCLEFSIAVNSFKKPKVTTQHNLRWHHQKAGLSCFGSVGCLTELGIVHQGVAHQ